MPGRNQKGPEGKGPMTGRKQGKCGQLSSGKNRKRVKDIDNDDRPVLELENDYEHHEDSENEEDFGRGRGFGRGQGCGIGRGQGRGRGFGRGAGNGRGIGRGAGNGRGVSPDSDTDAGK